MVWRTRSASASTASSSETWCRWSSTTTSGRRAKPVAPTQRHGATILIADSDPIAPAAAGAPACSMLGVFLFAVLVALAALFDLPGVAAADRAEPVGRRSSSSCRGRPRPAPPRRRAPRRGSTWSCGAIASGSPDPREGAALRRGRASGRTPAPCRRSSRRSGTSWRARCAGRRCRRLPRSIRSRIRGEPRHALHPAHPELPRCSTAAGSRSTRRRRWTRAISPISRTPRTGSSAWRRPHLLALSRGAAAASLRRAPAAGAARRAGRRGWCASTRSPRTARWSPLPLAAEPRAAAAAAHEGREFRSSPERPTFVSNEFYFRFDFARPGEPDLLLRPLPRPRRPGAGRHASPCPLRDPALGEHGARWRRPGVRHRLGGASPAGIDPPMIAGVVHLAAAAGAEPSLGGPRAAPSRAGSPAALRGRSPRSPPSARGEAGAAESVPYVLHGVVEGQGAVAAFQVAADAPGWWCSSPRPSRTCR